MRSRAGQGSRADEPIDAEIDEFDDASDPVPGGARERLRRARLRRAGRSLPELSRRRIALWSLAVVAMLGVLAGVAWFTPALSVRTVEIRGLKSVPEEQVREVLRIPEGISMLRIDTDAVARRVAALPKMRSARVQRVFPATVRVTVDERMPVLFFDGPEGTHLLDGDSTEFAIEPPPPGVPKLTTEHPGGSDPVTRAAVAVLDAAPPGLRAQVGEVVARSVSDIALNLTDGRTVLWGGPGDSERKAAVVLPVLSRPGTVFDVSSPDLVTVK
ncbi:FtsQ-type POTRA domain-containing protein [Nocardia sp. CDC159]|uniref:FtsQ-type POTRA domain-containing protein n=1 Tax=Nocardia pulmonis TaxID=2951408 RepID=A0A9X2E484_9NOCA|nr:MULTISPECIES: FtsQ-type POTRA domain-containing protein [Nocardia]MCM6773331.1 FtsQ-type POTRA domain-containing protein [Nocardia pulmonis]MCM6786218.1 FtsQ-type POTRA domain-containing protein [Nocardia sp. CDC159]